MIKIHIYAVGYMNVSAAHANAIFTKGADKFVSGLHKVKLPLEGNKFAVKYISTAVKDYLLSSYSRVLDNGELVEAQHLTEQLVNAE